VNGALPCVLFVDDEERILRSLRMLFRGRAEILATTSGREAVELVRNHRVHVVVSDQRMPGMTGVDVLREVAACSPATMRILLTGYADLDAMTASVNEGEIYRFVEKPWDAQRLIATVEQAARIAMDEFDVQASRGAEAAPTANAIADAERAAAHVLVLDEDGAIAAQVRELLPPAVAVVRAGDLESALDALATQEVAVMIAQLSSADGDVADALKQLKRLRPAMLAIVLSSLRDSRLLLGLINEGQVFRFLLQPPPRELLRRALIAALERHEALRTQTRLLRRHDVEAPSRAPAATISARVLGAWRRLREATVARIA